MSISNTDNWRPKVMSIRDLTIESFEGFRVTKYLGRRNNNSYWECVCTCGSYFESSTSNLTRRPTTSCGCRKSKKISQRLRRHGYTVGGKNNSKKTEYAIWRAIKYRCLVRTSRNYAQYGGRGITICDRWLNSFENFLEDMGNRPSEDYSIDRMDNDKGYSKENCHWATAKEQAYNRRTNVFMVIDGEQRVVGEWMERFGMSRETLGRLYFRMKLNTSSDILAAKVRVYRVKPKKRAFLVKIGDVIFDDATEAAKHFNIDVSNICRWVKLGKAEYLPRDYGSKQTEAIK